jgi:hypothetical protein
MAHQDMLHLFLLKQRVVNRQHRAAGIAENVLDALIGECRDHHFRAGHLSHRTLHSLAVGAGRESIDGNKSKSSNEHSNTYWNQVTKKGLEGPWSRTATSRGWPSHPRRCASIRGSAKRTDARVCLLVCCLNARVYKHCVTGGQANCGNNLVLAPVIAFKLAFEIGMTRQIAIVDQP